MKLKKVTNGNKHPKSELNIEIAHVAAGAPNYAEKLKDAIARSQAITAQLNIERYNFRICHSLLVDDKRTTDFNRDEWLQEVSRHVPDLAKSVDYVTFESDLKNLLNTFYSKLRADKQSTIKNEIERYLQKRKKMACSHDIALWHSLRLGALGGRGIPVYELIDPKSTTAPIKSSFIARHVCSVLPDTDRNHEEDAETDILRHLDRRFGDWRMVKRYYYET